MVLVAGRINIPVSKHQYVFRRLVLAVPVCIVRKFRQANEMTIYLHTAEDLLLAALRHNSHLWAAEF